MSELDQLNTKVKILEGVRLYLIKNGSQNFSARSVAKEAGVNHGLIHHYFGSKENLILAFIDHFELQTKKVLTTLMQKAGEKPPIATYLNEVVLNKEVSTVITELLGMSNSFESVKEKLNEVMRKRIELLGQLISSDNQMDAVLLFALIQGLIAMGRFDSELEAGPLIQRFIEKIEGEQ